MQDERSQEPELAGLEAQLAALVPKSEMDRDRLMFEAGARAARRKLQVVNRLLAAACVLLAVTTVAPLAMQKRGNEMAGEEPGMAITVKPLPMANVRASEAEDIPLSRLPDQLVAADSRELAVALAEGRSELWPARLREGNEVEGGTSFRGKGDARRPKSSRMLLRDYLDADGKRL
jgi:hypothetical protein